MKNQRERLRESKGITLIALVVTIVVLLILAGISITVLFGDSGIIKTAKDAGDKWNQVTQKEQEDMKNLANQLNELMGNNWWTQDKTSITNGTVTLEVGQAVTGYEANGVGDGNWYVLGAQNGKLLITTGSNQGTVTLSGKDGYANGVTKLNTEGAKFKDTNMAESARSIDVEDINRVTGYDPDKAKYGSGNNVEQWKNEVTYTLNTDTYIHYKGTKYPKDDTTSTCQKFEYWNGSNWVPLAEGESQTITYDFYAYYPQTTSTTPSSESQINGITSAYTLLFANTSGEASSYYWLSSQYAITREGLCRFGIRSVLNGYVSASALYNSQGEPNVWKEGLRPVVSLKSTVKVTQEGDLSM